MDFVDEIKDKASDVANVTGQKVAEIYSAARLKIAISERKNQLRTLYRELGEMVYEATKGENEENSNAIEDKIAEISLAREVLEELKASDRQMRKLKVCPNCNEKMDEKSRFCPNCGNEM